MRGSAPTSIILPSVRWTPVVEELAVQLGSDDELLVVCDRPDDPVAARAEEFPAGVRLVVAGEPEGCSGKANAVAAGLAAADNDRFVWTDDDFEHPPDWLAQLQADYAEHGPVTELPVFVGEDPLAVLLEPLYAQGGTLGVYVGGKCWGGAVVFERDDLDADLEAFLADLRRTVSDDGLLSEYLDVTPVRRCRRVAVGGSIRATLERHVRFMQIVARHEPRRTPVTATVSLLAAAGCLLFPVGAFLVATLLTAAIYAYFDIRRWTVVLGYPAAVVNPVLLGYALARRSFVWGGRRYHWPSKFDVRIRESP